MAQPTNFKTGDNDLSTIFAPIAVNQIDYGVLCEGNDRVIGNSWITIATNTQNASNNVVLTGGGGRAFKITSPGFYRLNITLNFGEASSSLTVKNIVYILSNNPDYPASSYGFTPSPKMSTIYAINCSGSNGYNGNATNYLNYANLGNCLTLNQTQNTFSTDEYFFSFPVFCNGTTPNSNFFTLDITFKTFFNTGEDFQMIYPYIKCREDTNIKLQNSKWMFTKINNIPT